MENQFTSQFDDHPAMPDIEFNVSLPAEEMPADSQIPQEDSTDPAEFQESQEAHKAQESHEDYQFQETYESQETHEAQESHESHDLPDELLAAVEGILFTMGDSVEVSAIARALDVTQKQIWKVVDALDDKYSSPSCGIMLQRFDDAVQMSTKPDQYENLIRIAKVPKKISLSESVIEPLSIIAYKQPITKAEVEAIRGVSSDYAINKLIDYDLVRELGRKDAPGRPLLFGTTEQFLRSFGVRSLSELPSLSTVKEEEFKSEAEHEIDSRLSI